jgi:hypothetical protein
VSQVRRKQRSVALFPQQVSRSDRVGLGLTKELPG